MCCLAELVKVLELDKTQPLPCKAAFCAWLQIAEASALDDATRQLAAELLITLCEAREKAPGMMRKLPQFIGRFFQILLAFLLDIEVRLPEVVRARL